MYQVIGGSKVVFLEAINPARAFINHGAATFDYSFDWVNRAHTEIGRPWQDDCAGALLNWLAEKRLLGGAAEMQVVGLNGTPITNRSAEIGADLGTDFGVTCRGAPVDHTFSVTNPGRWTLVLDQPVSTSDHFSFEEWPERIAPGMASNFTVRYRAAATGVYSATLVITNNVTDETPYEFDVGGEAVPGPALLALGVNGQVVFDNETPSLPKGTDIGEIPAHQAPASRFLMLTNPGTERITIAAVQTNLGGGVFELRDVSLPLMLETGATALVELRFDPEDPGAYEGRFTLENDSSNAPLYRLQTRGMAVRPRMRLLGENGEAITNHATLICTNLGTDFGASFLQQDAVREYTVTNSGFGTLLITNAFSTNAAFRVVAIPEGISSGGVSVLTVAYRASSVETNAGEMVLENNTGDENPYRFAVQGEGVLRTEPWIRVFGTNGAMVSGDETPHQSDGTDFGELDVPLGRVTNTFVVANEGQAPLVLSGVTTSAIDTVLQLDGLPAALGPGESHPFVITADASEYGIHVAQFIIDNNSSNAAPFILNARTITADPEVRDFPSWIASYDLEDEEADPDADPDGDGYANLQEFIARTDPSVSNASLFEVHSFGRSADSRSVIGFPTVSHRLYDVYTRTNLVNGEWGLIRTNMPGAGGLVEIEIEDDHEQYFIKPEVKLSE